VQVVSETKDIFSEAFEAKTTVKLRKNTLKVKTTVKLRKIL
jgi:hypothetical protein